VTLNEKVADWIDGQGYPLELKVAEAVRASNGWWDHGRVYTDLESGKVREIDVMAVFRTTDERRGATLQLIIECKHTRDKPWVIFTTDDHVLSAQGYVSALPHTERVRARLRQASEMSETQRVSALAAPEREGFRLVKAMTPAQDTAYQATGTLVGAGRSLAAHMSAASDAEIVFVPVLVIDGPLFEAFLAPGAERLTVQPASTATLVQPMGNGDRMPIKVVTFEALTDYLAEVATSAKVLGGLLGSVLARARSKPSAVTVRSRRTAPPDVGTHRQHIAQRPRDYRTPSPAPVPRRELFAVLDVAAPTPCPRS